MWTCPFWKQKFSKTNQVHSCGDKTLDDFLSNRAEHTIELFWHFAYTFQKFGKVTIHPTKSMIGFAAKTRMAYVIRVGENFVDVVFPFNKPYQHNLCFHKIAHIPGTHQYNHHVRLTSKADLNAEVKKFMKLAYSNGN